MNDIAFDPGTSSVRDHITYTDAEDAAADPVWKATASLLYACAVLVWVCVIPVGIAAWRWAL